VSQALAFGLTDVERIERMLLRELSGDFFQLPAPPPGEDDDDDER